MSDQKEPSANTPVSGWRLSFTVGEGANKRGINYYWVAVCSGNRGAVTPEPSWTSKSTFTVTPTRTPTQTTGPSSTKTKTPTPTATPTRTPTGIPGRVNVIFLGAKAPSVEFSDISPVAPIGGSQSP